MTFYYIFHFLDSGKILTIEWKTEVNCSPNCVNFLGTHPCDLKSTILNVGTVGPFHWWSIYLEIIMDCDYRYCPLSNQYSYSHTNFSFFFRYYLCCIARCLWELSSVPQPYLLPYLRLRTITIIRPRPHLPLKYPFILLVIG